MISWYKVGQKVQCIFGGRWMFKRRTWFGQRRWSEGPGSGAVLVVAGVVSRDGEIWFLLEGWNGLFPTRCFRPVYPHIIDQLRRLDAPSPSLVVENA